MKMRSFDSLLVALVAYNFIGGSCAKGTAAARSKPHEAKTRSPDFLPTPLISGVNTPRRIEQQNQNNLFLGGGGGDDTGAIKTKVLEMLRANKPLPTREGEEPPSGSIAYTAVNVPDDIYFTEAIGAPFVGKSLNEAFDGVVSRQSDISCFEDDNNVGLLICVLENVPYDGYYTAFYGCPTGGTLLDCSSCAVLDRLDSDPGICQSCSICSVGGVLFSFDCSNLGTGSCSEGDCDGNCVGTSSTDPPSGGCIEDEDNVGLLFCVLANVPFDGFYTALVGCTDKGGTIDSINDCLGCAIVEGPESDDEFCQSCSICSTSGIAFDCSNLDTGTSCSEVDCNGDCLETSPTPVPTSRPTPSPTDPPVPLPTRPATTRPTPSPTDSPVSLPTDAATTSTEETTTTETITTQPTPRPTESPTDPPVPLPTDAATTPTKETTTTEVTTTRSTPRPIQSPTDPPVPPPTRPATTGTDETTTTQAITTRSTTRPSPTDPSVPPPTRPATTGTDESTTTTTQQLPPPTSTSSTQSPPTNVAADGADGSSVCPSACQCTCDDSQPTSAPEDTDAGRGQDENATSSVTDATSGAAGAYHAFGFFSFASFFMYFH